MIHAKLITHYEVDDPTNGRIKKEHCVGEITMTPEDSSAKKWFVKFSVGGTLDNKLAKICEVTLDDFNPKQWDEWGAYALLVSAVGGVLQTRKQAEPKIIVPSGRG